jgi:hypothetical protein
MALSDVLINVGIVAAVAVWLAVQEFEKNAPFKKRRHEKQGQKKGGK